MSRLVALYPRAWRDRYEDEYLALLADTGPDPRNNLDIVRGAIDARLHPQVAGSPATPVEPPSIGRWSVIAGWTTLVGAVLWFAGLVLIATGPMVVDGADTYRDGSAGMPLLFLAMVCLGIGMIAVVISIPPSRPTHAAAYISSLSGLLWAGAPWLLWAGLIAFGGLVVVGGRAWRTGAWSAWRFVALVASIGTAWGLGFAVMSGWWIAPEGIEAVFFGIIGAIWPVVGTSLVWPRRPADALLGSRQG